MPSPSVECAVRNYFQVIDNGQLDLLGQFAASGYRLYFAGMPAPQPA